MRIKTSYAGRGAALLFIASLVLGTTSASPARAANGSNIGVHLGYAKAEGAEEGNGLVGGHLELRPARWFGIQGAVDYRHVEEYTVSIGGFSDALDVRSVPVTVSARFLVPSNAWKPYGVAGAGWYYLVYDYSEELELLGAEDETENTFGWHVGAGLEVPLSPKVSLFGEGRAVFVDPDKDLDDDDANRITELDYDSTYFSGGLNLHF